jgi:membrane fusion protein (multidrug efflux system)
MKINYVFSSILISSLFVFDSCKEEVKQQQRPPQKVQVVKVIQTDLPIYKEFVGSIFGYKDIPIRARVEGFLESKHFEEGKTVAKGQLLYTIDSQPFQADVAAAESKVAEAKTRLVNAQNEYDRYAPLADSKAVSQSDVDAAEASRDAAIANLDAAKANQRMSEINLSYATMYSPINGIIGMTQAKVGEYVGKDPNPVILNTVSRLDTVRVQFFLSEAQYLTVMKSYSQRAKDNPGGVKLEKEAAKENVSLKLSDGSTYKHNGHIDFIDRNINESTGAILVQASFPNPEFLLRPGLYAKVRLMFSYDKNSIIIPQRAVMETQGQFAVMVLTDSNTVVSRQITVGEPLENGKWQVLTGLKANEQIVFEGLQKVRSGAKVEAESIPFSLDQKQ